ncbi:uncharacterized protein LOC116738519 [Nasonia vitripennis]|uniref:Spaetzle domain-containing protein n=1 Tax=Nasonia vitripennis TaxID=7425 RepID=A0A7M7QSF0_NASVI|nr:uncharacterized protein LOC116738519 [Nasonia vitripennis]
MQLTINNLRGRLLFVCLLMRTRGERNNSGRLHLHKNGDLLQKLGSRSSHVGQLCLGISSESDELQWIRMKVFLGLLVAFSVVSFAFAAECKTSLTVIQPKEDVAVDNQRYVMINIPGFEQNATSVECLSGQTCAKGSCQQDYKLHQFLTVPHGKSQFSLDELQFRFFRLPYGCKCGAA